MDVIWQRKVISLLTKEVEAKESAVLEGFPATFEIYRERVGEIRGMRAALEIMEEASRKMSEVESPLRQDRGTVHGGQ